MSDQAPLDVHEVLAVMVDQLAAISWQKLGLQPDMISGKIAPDFDQAKTAIDAVAQLAAILEPKLDEDDRRQMNNLVRDLRINYLDKASNR